MAHASNDADAATWAEIRDVAFQITLLTRRADNFWSLPTVRAELSEDWAEPGTREAQLRKDAKFGHPSITVSFNALTAIDAATGSPPEWIAPATLQAIDTHRGPHGGYGTPGKRMGQVDVNAVPRHTAMAAVTHLLFAPGGAPDALSKYLEPTVEWLLTGQLKGGGWPYDWAIRPASVGFMSTAGALCALCRYLDLGHAPKPLAARAKSAIAKGYAALVAQQRSGAWRGDGAPDSSQLANAAFVLRLLRIADGSGRLSELMPANAMTLPDLVTLFSSNARAEGWPDRLGSEQADSITSISALTIVRAFGDPAGLGAAATGVAEDRILADWRNGTLVEGLTAWDWQCATIFGAARAGPIAPDEVKRLVARCEDVRSKWLGHRLKPRDLDELHPIVRQVATYSLTEGQGFGRRSLRTRLLILWNRLVAITVETLWGWVVGLILIALSYVLFGTEISDYMRRWFESGAN